MAKPSVLNDLESSDNDIDADKTFDGDEEAAKESLVEHLGSELPDPEGKSDIRTYLIAALERYTDSTSIPTFDLPSNQLLREQAVNAEERTPGMARTRDMKGVEGAALLSAAKSKGRFKRPSGADNVSVVIEHAPSSSNALAGGSTKRRRDPFDVTSPESQIPPPPWQSAKATHPVEAAYHEPQEAQVGVEKPASGTPKGKLKAAESPQLRRSTRHKSPQLRRSTRNTGQPGAKMYPDAVTSQPRKRPKTGPAPTLPHLAETTPRVTRQTNKTKSLRASDQGSTGTGPVVALDADAGEQREPPQPTTTKKPTKTTKKISKPPPKHKPPQQDGNATTSQEKAAAAAYYDDNEEEGAGNAQEHAVIVDPDIFDEDTDDASVAHVLCGQFKKLQSLFQALDGKENAEHKDTYSGRAKSRLANVAELQELCLTAFKQYALHVTKNEEAREDELDECIANIHELVTNLTPEDFTMGTQPHTDDLYKLVFPRLLRVLRASLAWYAVMAQSATPIAIIAQLQQEISLMRLIVQLRMKARPWPKPTAGLIKPLVNTVIAPLKNDVLPAFAKDLSSRKTKQAEVQKMHQLRLQADQRHKMEEEKRTEAREAHAKRLELYDIYVARMEAEPDLRKRGRLQMQHDKPDAASEFDANGLPFERLDVFAHESSRYDANAGWTKLQREMLAVALQRYHGKFGCSRQTLRSVSDPLANGCLQGGKCLKG